MIAKVAGLSRRCKSLQSFLNAMQFSPPHARRLRALTGIAVTWLYGFQFEIKVIAKLPDSPAA